MFGCQGINTFVCTRQVFSKHEGWSDYVERVPCVTVVNHTGVEVQVLPSAECCTPNGCDKQFMLLILFIRVPGAAPEGGTGSEGTCR